MIALDRYVRRQLTELADAQLTFDDVAKSSKVGPSSSAAENASTLDADGMTA
jgi:hypothetical protein